MTLAKDDRYSLKVPADLQRRADALAAGMPTIPPRSAVLMEALRRGLKELESEAARPAKRRRNRSR